MAPTSKIRNGPIEVALIDWRDMGYSRIVRVDWGTPQAGVELRNSDFSTFEKFAATRARDIDHAIEIMGSLRAAFVGRFAPTPLGHALWFQIVSDDERNEMKQMLEAIVRSRRGRPKGFSKTPGAPTTRGSTAKLLPNIELQIVRRIEEARLVLDSVSNPPAVPFDQVTFDQLVQDETETQLVGHVGQLAIVAVTPPSALSPERLPPGRAWYWEDADFKAGFFRGDVLATEQGFALIFDMMDKFNDIGSDVAVYRAAITVRDALCNVRNARCPQRARLVRAGRGYCWMPAGKPSTPAKEFRRLKRAASLIPDPKFLHAVIEGLSPYAQNCLDEALGERALSWRGVSVSPTRVVSACDTLLPTFAHAPNQPGAGAVLQIRSAWQAISGKRAAWLTWPNEGAREPYGDFTTMRTQVYELFGISLPFK